MPLPVPPIGVSTSFLPFATVAVAMVAVTIFVLGKVLPSNHGPPLVTQMLLALAVLGGGSVLLMSLVMVFFNPDGTSAWTWVLLAFNFMMMAPAGIWFIGLVVFQDRRIRPNGWLWPAALGVVAIGSEALMGILFAVAGPATPPPDADVLALGLSSVWFYWSMAAVMGALIAWAPLSRVEREALLALTGAAIVAPWVTAFPTVGGLGMAALMVVAFALLVRHLLARRVVAGEIGLLGGLAAAFFAMAIGGLGVATANGSIASAEVFGGIMAVVMTVEASYLIRRYYQGPIGRPWLSRPLDDDVPATGARPALDAAPRETVTPPT